MVYSSRPGSGPVTISGPIANYGQSQLLTNTISANGADVGSSFDAQNYQSVSVQVSGAFTGTLTYQVSLDGTNWVAKQLVTAAGGVATTATAAAIASGDIGARYFRVVATAWTTGTATVTLIFSAFSLSNNLNSTAVTGTLTANLGTGGTGATSLGKAEDAAHASGDTGVATWGVRNDNAATAGTSANGDYGSFAIDVNGAQFSRVKPALTAVAPATQTPGTTNLQLAAANAARRIGIIQNNSNVAVNIRFGATAATTAVGGYHMILAAGATYELPDQVCTAIQIIAASAGTGPVTFAEFTD